MTKVFSVTLAGDGEPERRQVTMRQLVALLPFLRVGSVTRIERTQ
jgi:hypothetical protein